MRRCSGHLCNRHYWLEFTIRTLEDKNPTEVEADDCGSHVDERGTKQDFSPPVFDVMTRMPVKEKAIIVQQSETGSGGRISPFALYEASMFF